MQSMPWIRISFTGPRHDNKRVEEFAKSWLPLDVTIASKDVLTPWVNDWALKEITTRNKYDIFYPIV